MNIDEVIKEFREKNSQYIKTVSVGQYNSEGVNIGFKTSEEVVEDWLRSTLESYGKKIEGKVVIWKDGSYRYFPEGVTWEYEADEDWLTTIPLSSLLED